MVWKITAILALGVGVLFWLLPKEATTQPETEKVVLLNIDGYQTKHTVVADTVGDFVVQVLGAIKYESISPSLDSRLESGDLIFITTGDNYPVNNSVAENIRIANEPEPEPEPEPIVVPEKKTHEVVDKPASKVYSGLATWYRWGEGLNTASRQFPRGTRLRVVAVNSGKTVDVVVNDYGPAEHTGVALDLNSVAFKKLAPLGAGKIEIEYFVIS